MAKETMEKMDKEGGCPCECHKKHEHGGMCEMSKKGDMGGMDEVNAFCSGHDCTRKMLKIMFAFTVALIIFWIGMACGEFRANWNQNSYFMHQYGRGGEMMQNQYQQNMMQPAVSLTQVATSTNKKAVK